jgi:hypothetical protein
MYITTTTQDVTGYSLTKVCVLACSWRLLHTVFRTFNLELCGMYKYCRTMWLQPNSCVQRRPSCSNLHNNHSNQPTATASQAARASKQAKCQPRQVLTQLTQSTVFVNH